MLLSTGAILVGKYGHEGNMDHIRKAGFDAMDFGMDEENTENILLHGDDWRGRTERLRKYADSIGLKINQTHTPFSWAGHNWVNPDYYRDIIKPAIVRSLEISAMLGAKVAVVHPRHQYLYLGHQEEIFRINMDFYRELLPYAKEFDIKLGIENIWQFDQIRHYIVHDTCSTADEFIRYIDTLDSDRIVGCLDIGHCALIPQVDQPQDFIRKLGHDRLQALHTHDNNGIDDQHLFPYCGRVDWREVTKALGEIDYQGDLTYEVTGGWARLMTDEGVDCMMNYLSGLGRSLMAQIDANRPQK